nr:Chain X, defensin, mutant DEF-ABB [Anopheles gambiae]
ATCDLASGFGVGSSLCAAHCLVKGYRGGYCKNKICHCRDKF